MPHDIEKRLRKVFRRVFGAQVTSDECSVDDIEEWDSLTHIKLIIELESEFEINIEPDEILSLYSSFSEISNFLNKVVER